MNKSFWHPAGYDAEEQEPISYNFRKLSLGSKGVTSLQYSLLQKEGGVNSQFPEHKIWYDRETRVILTAGADFEILFLCEVPFLFVRACTRNKKKPKMSNRKYRTDCFSVKGIQ